MWRPLGLPVWSNSAFLTQRLLRYAGPFRGGLSLCKPFILFQAVCPQPSTIQCAHSTVLCWDPWRNTMWEHVWYTKLPWADRPAQIHVHVLFKTCLVMCVCVCVLPWVHASALLTCSVALHLNDTFGFLANLPGVEGPNSNSDFYRCPRHICGFWLIPSKIPCISLLKETGKQKKRCLHPFYKNVFVLNN